MDSVSRLRDAGPSRCASEAVAGSTSLAGEGLARLLRNADRTGRPKEPRGVDGHRKQRAATDPMWVSAVHFAGVSCSEIVGIAWLQRTIRLDAQRNQNRSSVPFECSVTNRETR